MRSSLKINVMPCLGLMGSRSIGDLGIVVTNQAAPQKVHYYLCKYLDKQVQVVPVSITEFSKARPKDYCTTCLEDRTMAVGTIELVKVKGL